MPVTSSSRGDFSRSRQLDESLVFDGWNYVQYLPRSRMFTSTSLQRRLPRRRIARELDEFLMPSRVDDSLIFEATTAQPHEFHSSTSQLGESRTFQGGVTRQSQAVNGITTQLIGQLNEFSLNATLQESELIYEQMRYRLVPATIAAIETLKTVKVEENMVGKLKSSTCTVCLDGFECGMQLKRMPCTHVFHEDCIVTWLQQSNSCPVCRFKLQNRSL